MQLQEHHEVKAVAAGANMLIKVIIQIILIDMVFSLDSILTAVGLVDNVLIMIIAVVVAIGIMMLFAGPVSRIINKHPSLQMLALSLEWTHTVENQYLSQYWNLNLSWDKCREV